MVGHPTPGAADSTSRFGTRFRLNQTQICRPHEDVARRSGNGDVAGGYGVRVSGRAVDSGSVMIFT